MADTEDGVDEKIVVVDEDAAPASTETERTQETRKQPTTEETRTRPRGPWRVMDDPTISEEAKKYIGRQRFRRGEAERTAAQLAEENARLKAQLQATGDAGMQHYETAVTSRLEQAKRALKVAHESADADAITAATEELGSASSDAADLKRRKAAQPAKTEETTQQQRPQRPTFTPRTQQWVDENPWFQENSDEFDANATGLAIAIAQRMEKQGFKPDTEDYFEELDRRVRRAVPDLSETKGAQLDSDEDAEEEQTTVQEQQERKPAQARAGGAPRTATTTGKTGGAGPTQVKLTAEEKELARSMGIKAEDYARNKVIRQRQERA